MDRSVIRKRPLTSAFVKNVRHSGRNGPDKHGDQFGLQLRVQPTGGKQWIWRGTIHGKRVDLGLGGWPLVSLAEARQAAFDYKKLAREGGVDSRPTGQSFKMHSGTGWLQNKVPLVSLPQAGKPGLTRRFKSLTGRKEQMARQKDLSQ